MIIDRILKIIDLNNENKNQFYKKTGLSNGFLDKVKDIGGSKIEYILNSYPDINPEWLLTGKGEMLKSTVVPMQPTAQAAHLIPLYDGVVTASITGADLTPQTEPVEMVNAGDWFRDATAAMRVHGDSMHPDYPSGSIVAMREVQNKKLIVYGQDYLIETSEYRVLKRLQKSDKDQHWLLCSTNLEMWESGPLKGRLIHEPDDIHVDDVYRIYKILGSVKRNHSSRVVKI